MKLYSNAFLGLLIIAVMFWPAFGLAVEEQPPQEIDVTGATAIDAASVGKAQTLLTDKVLECAKTEDTPPLCQCRFQDELGVLRMAVDMALKSHPEWRDAIVTYREEGKPSSPVSFKAVRERLEECK